MFGNIILNANVTIHTVKFINCDQEFSTGKAKRGERNLSLLHTFYLILLINSAVI